ncbi:putative DUF21 domain-containing protein At3g13070, chloroplastic [Aristolochia californica]|uniref:putative DUF21 domain-containing protein At3g13070, chloroplastic n=1 Tax=Aristolochia californica TaxID=171875 RepID=UPI0035DC96C4
MDFAVESAAICRFCCPPGRRTNSGCVPLQFSCSRNVAESFFSGRSSKFLLREIGACRSKVPVKLVVGCNRNKYRVRGAGAFDSCMPQKVVGVEASSVQSPEGSILLKRGLLFVATACGVFMVGRQRAFSLEAVGVFERCGLLFRGGGMQLLSSRPLVLFLFLSLSAILSMAETSIITLWPWKVRELALNESENGVFKMLHTDANRFMTTILIGKTVFNIGATAIVTRAARKVFGKAGVGIAASVMIVTILLLTEITPKCIAVNYAEEVAKFVVTPVAWLSWVFYPIGRFANFISLRMLKMFGLNRESESDDAKEEPKLKVQRVELDEKMKKQEKNMIKNVLEMKGTVVKEVMTPLKNVVAIDAGAKLIDFKQLWVAHKCSRIPVYETLLDNIVGIAYVKDLVKYVKEVEKLKSSSVVDIVRKPVYFVPDSMSIRDLLREFRLRRVHMAVVVNENGGTMGLVTLEDVMQEIFGESSGEIGLKDDVSGLNEVMALSGEGF